MAPVTAEGVVAASGEVSEPAPVAAETTEEVAAETQEEPQEPKVDFSIGIGQTDAQREAQKRIDRAKRFGTTGELDEEERKRAERVKKFGGEAEAVDVKGIDGALPERKKRVREGREQGGRDAKRQTPDRRAEPVNKQERPPVPRQAAKQTATAQQKRVLRSVLDDPVEKAKAEARAKKFGAPAPAAST